MPILSVDKTVDHTQIEKGGTFNVTLSVTAAPEHSETPVDIALVLDRSGSMRGTPLESLKQAAKEFVSLLAGGGDSLLGDNRVGVISFANSAVIDAQLTQDVPTLEAAIDGLAANGNTNTGDAFSQANAMLSASPAGKKRIMILFTDGEPTIGANPAPIAQDMKQAGVEIYCIGYEGSDGMNLTLLQTWASSPSSKYVLVAPTESEIRDAFEDIAEDILVAGAENIYINEMPLQEFEIISVGQPNLGTAEVMPGGLLRWHIPVLGAHAEETARLTFTLKDTGSAVGTMNVNQSIYLTDDAKESVRFPVPTITIEDGVTEDCPTPVDVVAGPCVDSVSADLGDVAVPGMGRMMEVSLTLKHVCPGRQVSVGILVTEVLPGGEVTRGFKAVAVPAQQGDVCADIQVKNIHFVLPEPAGASMCQQRTFRVRAFANAASGTWGEECLETQPEEQE